MKNCSVTVDVDCLRSNFKGFGLRNGEYSFGEFSPGLEACLEFFFRFNIRATFFFVARDCEDRMIAGMVRKVTSGGHEIASHSYTHPQGFRFLAAEEKRNELKMSKEVLEDVSGQRVAGFRAPGWNISDDTLPILRELGFAYDASVFPTSLAPLLKIMHAYSMRKRDSLARTTLGEFYYSFSPVSPYRSGEKKLGRRGSSDFFEFPVQVSGFLRLPFYSTFHLSYPFLIERGYSAIRDREMINYQMHLSDFVDYTTGSFDREIPREAGSYRPLSLRMGLDKKLMVWKKVFAAISRDFQFLPVRETLEYL
jgi:hypothetical protein